MSALGAVYRWACAPTRGYLTANAVRGLEMPARDEKGRDRIAPRRPRLSSSSDALSASRPAATRATRSTSAWRSTGVCATASASRSIGAGVDLDRGRLHVRKSKTNAGIRTLPIIKALRPILRREWLRQGKPDRRSRRLRPQRRLASPMTSRGRRVGKAWAAAELDRITPHECRHTFASYLIAAGLNPKAVTVLLGHSSIQITFDRYGHLFPGHEDEAAERLDAYIAAAVTKAVTNGA